MKFTKPLLLLLVLHCGGSVHAQEIGGGWTTSYDFYGAPDDRLGSAIAIAGDVNSDGYDDIIIGSENASSPGAIRGGTATIYSGRSGAALHHFVGPGNIAQFGHSVCGLGDVDGDGVDDVAISAYRAAHNFPQAGAVFVYSGASGAQIFRFDGSAAFLSLGARVSAIGDLDNDGHQDIMASSETGTSGTGTIYVWSGANGTLLLTIDGPQVGAHFGQALAAAGDVNGDGIVDILVGAPSAASLNLVENGAAAVYSGASGTALYTFRGHLSRQHLGAAVAGVGDLDGDGCADFFIGSPGLGPVRDLSFGGATLYSGRLGHTLFHLDGAIANNQLGSGVASIGDFDGDGIPDVAVGSQGCSPMGAMQAGTIAIHSGAHGKLLYTFSGETPFDHLGNSFAGGDVNHDGRADLVFASADANPGGQMNAGTAYVRGGFDPYLTSSQAQLSASAGGTLQFDINFPSSAAQQFFVLLASDQDAPSIFDGVAVPLDSSTLIWNQMLHAPPLNFSNPSGWLDSNGDATCLFTAPPQALNYFSGSTLRFAVLCKDHFNSSRYCSSAVTLQVVP